MKREILNFLCCPNCKNDLTLIETQAVNEEIMEGFLECSNCQKLFKINKGVPRMIINLGNRKETAESWDFAWTKVAEGMFEVDTLYGITEDEELKRFFRYMDVVPDNLRGKFILDAGCGRGRLVKALVKDGAEVFGIDISSTLMDVYKDYQHCENANIIQADMLNLPFRGETFDYVWSFGSIFLTGDTKRTFKSLCNLVKSSGKLFVSLLPTRHKDFGDKLRDFLRISHRIPKNVLFSLCYIVAVPLSLIKKILNMPGASLRTTAFFLFVDLSAPIRSRHTENEVINWFKEEKFHNITFVNSERRILVRGTKR